MTSLLLAAVLTVTPSPTSRCPLAAGIKSELKVDGPRWMVSCFAADKGDLQMAALARSTSPNGVPHLVVGIVRSEFHMRIELDLEGVDRGQIAKLRGEDGSIAISPAHVPGADWLRVAFTDWNLGTAVTQEVTSLFRIASGRIRHLWTGLGYREEVRLEVCVLHTLASFSLSDDGKLIRERTTRGSLRPRAPPEILERAKTACIAAPTKRDSFRVEDDGLNADMKVSRALRARARANRLLFIRAAHSTKALVPFVADSLALLEPLTIEVSSGEPADPTAGNWGISLSGAYAYAVEGGMRNGLDWKNLRSITGIGGPPMVDALKDFHQDDLGAWIEPQTDYGGCHQPRQAEPALRRLIDAWTATSRDVRAAFKPWLAIKLAEMTGNDCFCDAASNRAEIQQALDRNAALLEKHLDIDTSAGAKLRLLLSRPTVRFSCIGPH